MGLKFMKLWRIIFTISGVDHFLPTEIRYACSEDFMQCFS